MPKADIREIRHSRDALRPPATSRVGSWAGAVDVTANPGVLSSSEDRSGPIGSWPWNLSLANTGSMLIAANSAVAANQSRLNRRYSISARKPHQPARKAIGNDGGIWRMSF